MQEIDQFLKIALIAYYHIIGNGPLSNVH